MTNFSAAQAGQAGREARRQNKSNGAPPKIEKPISTRITVLAPETGTDLLFAMPRAYRTRA